MGRPASLAASGGVGTGGRIGSAGQLRVDSRCSLPREMRSRFPSDPRAGQGLGTGALKVNNEPVTKDTNPGFGKVPKDPE
ncbi:hypothetical protein GCM10009642_25580 [Nocardiopsis metallicus]